MKSAFRNARHTCFDQCVTVKLVHSSLHITLPMDQTTRESTLAGRRILVVEDMAMVAQEIEFILNRMDCGVIGPAANLDSAVNLVDSNDVDGVILDINLQGVASFPIADVLEERGIPFLFMTGYGSGSIPHQYQHHPRLEKPFGHDDLARSLVRMFDSKLSD